MRGGAPGRRQGGVGVREAWGGGPGRRLAKRPLPSLSKPATPSHQTLFGDKAKPHSPCGQGRRLGNWQGRQAEACPPQGNQPSPHLPGPRECPSGWLPHGTNEGEGMEERGKSVPSREKVLEEGRSSFTRAQTHSLSLSLLSPITAQQS